MLVAHPLARNPIDGRRGGRSLGVATDAVAPNGVEADQNDMRARRGGAFALTRTAATGTAPDASGENRETTSMEHRPRLADGRSDKAASSQGGTAHWRASNRRSRPGMPKGSAPSEAPALRALEVEGRRDQATVDALLPLRLGLFPAVPGSCSQPECSARHALHRRAPHEQDRFQRASNGGGPHPAWRRPSRGSAAQCSGRSGGGDQEHSEHSDRAWVFQGGNRRAKVRAAAPDPSGTSHQEDFSHSMGRQRSARGVRIHAIFVVLCFALAQAHRIQLQHDQREEDAGRSTPILVAVPPLPPIPSSTRRPLPAATAQPSPTHLISTGGSILIRVGEEVTPVFTSHLHRISGRSRRRRRHRYRLPGLRRIDPRLRHRRRLGLQADRVRHVALRQLAHRRLPQRPLPRRPLRGPIPPLLPRTFQLKSGPDSPHELGKRQNTIKEQTRCYLRRHSPGGDQDPLQSETPR